MIRIAAVADLHIKPSDTSTLSDRFLNVDEAADLLLLPGDLTDTGSLEEAKLLIEALIHVRVPILAVLGNHDYGAGQPVKLSAYLRSNQVRVLDGDSVELDIRDQTVGIIGVKGFRGGFDEHAFNDKMEPEAAAWVSAVETEAAKIERGLQQLHTDYRIVLLHYAPIRATVQGEHPEELPFYGSSHLCEPIDRLGADVVIHGHAHHGTRIGSTPGGIPVYNVAKTLLDGPYALIELQ